MSSIYKVVCQNLQQVNAGNSSDLCCLCFAGAGTDAISINDKVVVDMNQNGSESEDLTEELMARILVDILGTQVTNSMSLFPWVCKECSIFSINSYKFIKKSKGNVENLIRAVDDLNSCFEIVVDDNDFKSLYVSVNLNEMTMQQFYDTKKQEDPMNTALPRFHFIAYGRPNNKPLKETSKCRDFSTIFIKTHELIHDPSKPKEYKCKICLKEYPASGNLRQHFFASHFKKDFPCTLCAKKFGTAGLLQSHMSVSHSAIECKECGKVLLNRTSTLKRHELTHLKPLKMCYRCGKTYKKTKDYERHIAQETCQMPSRVPGSFTCDTCGYHCVYKHQLLTHIKYEHMNAKGHICKWCSRKCYSASALKMHILKHTKERNFTCEECGGKFVNKQSLLIHCRLHTGERPYKCKQCDESFVSASRRKDHVERHHTDITYNCDICDAKYNARRSLVKHKKTHKPDPEW